MSKTHYSNTTLETQCQILATMWLAYRDYDKASQDWKNFFIKHDVGLPLAYMVWQDIATPKGDKDYIQETWADYCDMLGIDFADEYKDLQSTFDASEENERIRKEEDEED